MKNQKNYQQQGLFSAPFSFWHNSLTLMQSLPKVEWQTGCELSQKEMEIEAHRNYLLTREVKHFKSQHLFKKF